MKTLPIISQKGGAGKTTLALNLAAAAERQNIPTVVIDLDPQANAKTWHDIRVSKEAPFVVSAQASRLEAVRSYGLIVAPVKLTQRAAYVHSLTAGQTAQEFADLYKWTRTRIHASTLETVSRSA